jgi:(p)ppGpp synthase/HD superfamily hydrolase
VVHRQECPQVQYDSVSPKKLNSTGWLDLIWEENVPTEALYLASLRVGVKHVRNGLAQLVQYVSAQGVPIMDLSAAHKDGQQLELLISVQVSHLRELEGLMRLLKHQSWVSYVERLMKDKK